MSVVLRRIVVGSSNWSFNNLSRSHHLMMTSTQVVECQSPLPTTVLLRTTLIQTIKLYSTNNKTIFINFVSVWCIWKQLFISVVQSSGYLPLRPGKYPPLFTSTLVSNCLLVVWSVSCIKNVDNVFLKSLT